MTHVSHNSGNHEWYTPAHIVEAARQTMGGIDLDPASSEIANQLVKATRFITIEENGITANWGDAQRVWINPPYSQPAIKQFAKKTLCHLDMVGLRSASNMAVKQWNRNRVRKPDSFPCQIRVLSTSPHQVS